MPWRWKWQHAPAFLPGEFHGQRSLADYSPCERRSVMSKSLQPHGLYSPWNSPGRNTEVGSLSLLQEIFPTHGSNPGLQHHRWILYQILRIWEFTKFFTKYWAIREIPNRTYLDKKNKVLERCIEMCFLLKLDHRVEMLMINVSINPKEAFEYSFCHRHEILRKWDT